MSRGCSGTGPADGGGTGIITGPAVPTDRDPAGLADHLEGPEAAALAVRPGARHGAVALARAASAEVTVVASAAGSEAAIAAASAEDSEAVTAAALAEATAVASAADIADRPNPKR